MKYEIDRSGKNLKIGSPEHLHQQKVELTIAVAEAVFGTLLLAASIVALPWVGYVFEIQ